MKVLFYCIALLFFGFITKEKTTYEKVRTTIVSERSNLYRKWYNEEQENKAKILKEAGQFLYSSILDRLIPYWYGTAWDFNGYTAKPGEGKIACGYFVSTVMQHAGVNINRYKMAQKHSFEELKLYCCGEKLYDYECINRDSFIRKVKETNADGLYILGLSNHIGFLLKENNNIYFIHSSYRIPSKVVKEKAEDSAALEDSDRFILTSISSNKTLIKKWICNVKIGE